MSDSAKVKTQAPRASRPDPLYRQLQPRWSGLDPEGVAKDQRLRLIGAMTSVAGFGEGYSGANIKLLSALAGVSRRTFYDQFGTTEACFLATYEYVVGRAARHVTAAYVAQQGWDAKLRAAFGAYAAEVVAERGAARLALLEVLGAGPTARAEMDRGRQVFERMIRLSFAAAPDGVELPPLVAKAIVCGVERITRLRLLNGGLEGLPALADELLAWAVSYNSPALTDLPSVSLGSVRHAAAFRRRAPSDEDDRDRILRAAARIAASAGYAHLTPARVFHETGVCGRTFDEHFQSREQCFLDALDLLGAEALAAATRASTNAEDPHAAVRQGVAALLDHVAGNRVLQRIAFIEIFAVGRAGVERRERLLGAFTDLFVSTLPKPQRPPELTAQAIVGAIWAIMHRYVTQGAARQLPALANQMSYIALAPAIGAPAAVQCIQADLQAGSGAAQTGS